MASDQVKLHVHRTTREIFLALSYPRGFAEMLAEHNSLTVWVVLAGEEDLDVLHAAEAVSMSAEYSERYQGWIIQL